MVDNDWSLPVAFYFQVKVDGEEYAFKEVSGLTAEMDFEAIREGGSNDFGYKVPKQNKHGNLVLKRAIIPLDSRFIFWVKNVFEGNPFLPIVPKNIQINLLNGEGKSMATWSCSGAYPVKWSVDVLDTEKNNILIEALEFAYATLKRS
ncbi:phage tail protein [Parabacteroides sp. OttesenSCG-928-G07]|nr:phage tail protein [Parabacteroides sp. OttesenSCG-928-G21]MDL2278715.1 phage tail protein [Parabacteroides sp. OttesenSCG-928-G07]